MHDSLYWSLRVLYVKVCACEFVLVCLFVNLFAFAFVFFFQKKIEKGEGNQTNTGSS